jgi:hypothetical protein
MMNPRDEAKRQTIILIFTLAGTVGTLYLVAYFSDPDALRSLRMRLALRAKRLAQWQVDKWQSIADQAATIYNRERP